ncbi:MAG: hypothetical protein HGA75_14100 [Thiobacillus sp.]|nr:hypothetical protein [Thiobacillus sp.]
MDTHTPDRRQNHKLRDIYGEATELLHHLYKSHDDWVGSSTDFAALRAVHERFKDLTAQEVRVLVGAIGDRIQHGAEHHKLTALYS